MKKKIHAIVKRVGEDPCNSTLLNTLYACQACVNGYIEVVHIKPGLIMLVNEEALVRYDSPFNCCLRTEHGPAPLFGNVLFIGEDGDEFDDCPIGLDEVKRMIL